MATDDLADRLLCVLRARTCAPTLEYDGEPERLTGGFFAELLAFSLRNAPPGWDGALVARVMPDAQLARKETVVQTAAAAAGVPTPRVRGSGGPEDGLGRAYMVMDRADGVPLLAGLDSAAGLIGAPRRLWRMPGVLAEVMTKLHAVDPAPVRREVVSVDGVGRTIPEMLDLFLAVAIVVGRDDLAAAASWLIEHPVDAGDDVICHGDLHPFNVLVDRSGNVTLLDWSACLFGPRAFDVAFTSLVLSSPPVVVPGAVRPLIRAAGRGLARRFVNRYRRLSGATFHPQLIAWHQAVVCLRALVEVANWEHEGVVDAHAGHPWLILRGEFQRHLGAVTGVAVHNA